MISHRNLFLQHVAQTSDSPMMLEICRAEGIYMYDNNDNKYIDLISGISVSNLGHCHPKVVEAVKTQVEKYMHLMVYGEYVQTPQVKMAELLSKYLPDPLDNVYYVNSGSEAVEGAMKLAKRYTKRTEIVAFKKAYHGSTHGALSLMSEKEFSEAFYPLLPNIKLLELNNIKEIENITNDTACVIIELIQGEAGVRTANKKFVKALREKCNATGALLIVDEIQTGFGRTGKLFSFQQYDIVPDVILLAKGMGGGMPIGAFVSSREIMSVFTNNPVLGHITTFGGHPVSCAASYASLKVLLEEKELINSVNKKSELFKRNLHHPTIQEIRGNGLLMAVQLENSSQVHKLIEAALNKGLVVDWFLYCDSAFRIAPPLIISEEEIIESCRILKEALNEVI